MPRFTLRHLLLATTLIAVGVAIFAIGYALDWLAPYESTWAIRVGAFVACGATLGAGLGAPLRRMAAGALLGAIAGCLTLAAWDRGWWEAVYVDGGDNTSIYIKRF